MDTKVIPLRDFQADPEGVLRRCCDTGETLVVELADARLVSIQPLDDDDDLVNDLLGGNAAFQALVQKSAASPRKPFHRTTAEEHPPGNGKS